MKFIFDLTIGVISQLFTVVKDWIIITFSSGLSPEFPTVIFIIFCVSVFFASAFISATISELRGRNRLIHFLMGLCVPYIYPGLIYFLLPKYTRKSPEEKLFGDNIKSDKGLKIGRKETMEGGDWKESESDMEEVEINVPKAMNPVYFNALISRPEEIQKRENYIFELKDGSTLSALKINEVTQTLLVIEVMDSKKKRVKTIRLPYERIENCEIVPVDEDEVIAMRDAEEMLDPLLNDETRFMEVDPSFGDTVEAGTTVALSKEDLNQTLEKFDSQQVTKETEQMEKDIFHKEETQGLKERPDRHYFASIAVDESGNHRGPFIIEMLDGRILEAQRILETLDNVVVVESIGKEGKKRTIRIPYEKVMKCTDKYNWTG